MEKCLNLKEYKKIGLMFDCPPWKNMVKQKGGFQYTFMLVLYRS